MYITIFHQSPRGPRWQIILTTASNWQIIEKRDLYHTVSNESKTYSLNPHTETEPHVAIIYQPEEKESNSNRWLKPKYISHEQVVNNRTLFFSHCIITCNSLTLLVLRPAYLVRTTITRLLMPWPLVSPSHQQPWNMCINLLHRMKRPLCDINQGINLQFVKKKKNANIFYWY